MRPGQDRRRTLLLAGLFLLLVHSSARGEVLEKFKNIGGTTVRYKVVLPYGYDPAKSYPAVFAFPPGPQNMDVLNAALDQNWKEQAERRGYILIIPAAPNGELFFEGGQRVVPAFLRAMLQDFKIQDNKFHAAGNSNGGISAFYIAALYPQYFLSITGFPGFLPDATPASIRGIASMCINMYVGGLDTEWLTAMQRQSSQMRASGLQVRFLIEKDQPHRIATLTGAGASRLFDGFDEARHGCGH